MERNWLSPNSPAACQLIVLKRAKQAFLLVKTHLGTYPVVILLNEKCWDRSHDFLLALSCLVKINLTCLFCLRSFTTWVACLRFISNNGYFINVTPWMLSEVTSNSKKTVQMFSLINLLYCTVYPSVVHMYSTDDKLYSTDLE